MNIKIFKSLTRRMWERIHEEFIKKFEIARMRGGI